MEEVFRACVADERSRGRTVLLSSHILSEVEALCDRVTIIRAGQTVETGTLADLRHLTRITIEAETAVRPRPRAGRARRAPGRARAPRPRGRDEPRRPPTDARRALPAPLRRPPSAPSTGPAGTPPPAGPPARPGHDPGVGARARRWPCSSPRPPTSTSTRPSPRGARSSQTLGSTPATLALYGRIYADSVGGLVGVAAGRDRARARRADGDPARHAPHARGGGDRAGRARRLRRRRPQRAARRRAPHRRARERRARRDRHAGDPRDGPRGGRRARARPRLRVHRRSPSRASRRSRRSSPSPRGRPTGSRSRCSAASFAIRAIGDAGPHWLSWFSPLGWGQARARVRRRALVGPARCSLALAARASSVAARLKAERDLGAGILPPRPGPGARLAHPPARTSPGGSSAARSPAGRRASRSSARRSARSPTTSAT